MSNSRVISDFERPEVPALQGCFDVGNNLDMTKKESKKLAPKHFVMINAN
jgi:hypothetical protein